MTLDEAIKHAEEVMVENLEKTKDRNASDPIAIKCSECAEEHRQLAEWLKDYKRLLEQEPNDVLDKIRAEIENLEYLNIEDGSDGYDKYIEQSEVLNIIDKYKIQSFEASYDGYWENQNGDWSDIDEVLAWQPLPEPMKVGEEYCRNTFMKRTCEAYTQAIDKGIKALENQKTGHWIDYGARYDVRCSVCNTQYPLKPIGSSRLMGCKSNYCPGCGAKMGG